MASLDALKSQVKGFLDERYLLAEAAFTNSTFLKVGGYNARTYSAELDVKEKMRASEVKGVLRWWYRVLAAALLAGNYGDVERRLVEKMLGSTGEQSLVRVEVDSQETSGFDFFRGLVRNAGDALNLARELENIPRVKLLTIKKSGVERSEILCFYPPGTLRSHVRLYLTNRARISGSECRVLASVGALALALVLEGFGAMSSRGFAGVKLESFRVHSEALVGAAEAGKRDALKKHAQDLQHTIDGLIASNTPQSLKAKIEELIVESLRLVNDCEELGKKPCETPRIPTLDTRCGTFRLEVLEVKRNLKEADLLKTINEAFLGSRLRARESPQDIQLINKYLWFVGGPRRGRIHQRRKSAIRATVFEGASNKRFVIVHGFFSTDNDEKANEHEAKRCFDKLFDKVVATIRLGLG